MRCDATASKMQVSVTVVLLCFTSRQKQTERDCLSLLYFVPLRGEVS